MKCVMPGCLTIHPIIEKDSIMSEPYAAGPDPALDSDAIVTANKPLYTITLFDGTVIGGKMAYQEQYALVVGGAYWIDGDLGQYPDGCELRIPYNAIKFWHMQV